MRSFIFYVLVVLGQSFWCSAATYYQLQGVVRTFPRSLSGEAGVYYNDRLWQNTESGKPWTYGFWRIGASAAAHGQVAAKVDVYPVAIWQLSLQRSATLRFYDTMTLDCATYECRGVLHRGIFKTSLALGYSNFFFVPSYSLTDLTISSSKKNFSSEEDNLLADRSGDLLTTMQFAFGYRDGDQRWVFVHKGSKMKHSGDHNTSEYLVWNKVLDSQTNYFLGAGFYESNHASRTFSAVAGLNWSVGENLSLF